MESTRKLNEADASLNHQDNDGNTRLHLLLQADKFDYAAIAELLRQGAGVKAKNNLAITCLELFQEKLTIELDDLIKKLEQLVAEESKNTALASLKKTDALKKLLHTVPVMQDQIKKDLKSGHVSMLDALSIKESTANLLTAVINNNLKDEHIQSFTHTTQKLKTNSAWRIIIGAIIGAAVALLAIAAVVTMGIAVPVIATVGASVGGALIGGGLGFWSGKLKDPVKQIKDSAEKLALFTDHKKTGTTSMNPRPQLTQKQADFHKALSEKIDSLLESISNSNSIMSCIPSPFKENILTTKLRETLLSIQKDIQEFNIFEKRDLQQLRHKALMIDLIATKIPDFSLANKWRRNADTLRKLIGDFQYTPPPVAEEKKAEPVKHKITVIHDDDDEEDEDGNDIEAYTYLSMPGMSGKVATNLYEEFCKKERIRETEEYQEDEDEDFYFLYLNDDKLKKLLDMMEKNAIHMLQEIPDEKISLAKAKALVREEQRNKIKAQNDFLFELGNKIELVLLDFNLEDKLQAPLFNFGSLFSQNKSDIATKETVKQHLSLIQERAKKGINLCEKNELQRISDDFEAIYNLSIKINDFGTKVKWRNSIQSFYPLIGEARKKMGLLELNVAESKTEDLTKTVITFGKCQI